jgi:hypothetical protein
VAVALLRMVVAAEIAARCQCMIWLNGFSILPQLLACNQDRSRLKRGGVALAGSRVAVRSRRVGTASLWGVSPRRAERHRDPEAAYRVWRPRSVL